MKHLMLILIAIGSFVAFAAPRADDAAIAAKQAAAAERRAKRIAEAGGLVQTGGEGKVVIMNFQGDVAESQFAEDAKNMGKEIKTVVEVKKGEGEFSLSKANELLKKSGGNAVLFVVDDKNLPMSLVALESRWAVMNVGALKVDGADKTKLNVRAHKMFLRTACNLLGASTSRYTTSPMQPVASLADLDKVVGDILTFDAVGAMLIHMPKIGITRIKMMSYRKACYEGLAPAPANDLQKKIAEEVKKELAEDAAAEAKKK